MQILWDLPSKYDLNHERAEPQTPSFIWRVFNKILWSTVSKAARKSNNTKSDTCPLFIFMSKSFFFLLLTMQSQCCDGNYKRDWSWGEEIVLNHVRLNLIGYHTFSKSGHKLQVAHWSKILESKSRLVVVNSECTTEVCQALAKCRVRNSKFTLSSY